jgi:hypothetical protein
MRCSSFAYDDIFLAAYASQNQDTIDASALQACGDPTQRASSYWAASAGTTEPRAVFTRHSAADWGLTHTHPHRCRGDRHAEGAFSYIALEPDAPNIVQAPAFPPVLVNRDRSQSTAL